MTASVGYPGAGHSFAATPHAPARPQAHWSMYLFAAGCLAMLVSLVLTISGVPAAMFYDPEGKGERNRNTSHDPLRMSQSIDRNMKWIKENSGYEANQYNGYLSSINRSENAVPQMAGAVSEMTAGVEAIDASLTQVHATTARMNEDMRALADISNRSAATMTSLASDVLALSTAMGELYASTEQLTTAMGDIQRKAKRIADKRTSSVVPATRELNRALPDNVPPPTTTLDPGPMPVHPEGAA